MLPTNAGPSSSIDSTKTLCLLLLMCIWTGLSPSCHAAGNDTVDDTALNSTTVIVDANTTSVITNATSAAAAAGISTTSSRTTASFHGSTTSSSTRGRNYTSSPDVTCYTDLEQNTTCLSSTGICYVLYNLADKSTILGCVPPTATLGGATGYNNATNVTVTTTTSSGINAAFNGICPSDYAGYYANDQCAYCCSKRLCNRDKPASWVVADCEQRRSSASVLTVATASVYVVMATLSAVATSLRHR